MSSILLLIVMQAVLAFEENFVHDSTTTYCWHTNASYEVERPDRQLILADASGPDCPVELRNIVELKLVKLVDSKVGWTLQAKSEMLGLNKIGLSHLSFALDDSSGKEVNIIHSNIHFCDFGSRCSPFTTGTGSLSPTPNRVGNFSTDENYASFSDEIAFSNPGIYSLVAHVVLPSYDGSTRYDFATYSRIVVSSDDTAETDEETQTIGTTEEKKSGMSSTTIGIISAAVVVAFLIFGFVMYRRRRRNPPPRSIDPELAVTPMHQPPMALQMMDSYATVDVASRQHPMDSYATVQQTGYDSEDSDLVSGYRPSKQRNRGYSEDSDLVSGYHRPSNKEVSI